MGTRIICVCYTGSTKATGINIKLTSRKHAYIINTPLNPTFI